MSEPSTPLMRQYSAIKKEHPNALLFFRLGDFYELFFDDAVLAARELQITLTSRNKEKGLAIPMCGVPYHAAEGYIAKLIRRGFKVAVCEQVEDPRLAKKLVRREVTRVVTPGTAADSSLNAEENNFLAAVATVGDRVGFAALDLSTGDFRATEFVGEQAGRRIQEELEQLRPKEMLYGSSAPLLDRAATAVQARNPASPDPSILVSAGGENYRRHASGSSESGSVARISTSGWAPTDRLSKELLAVDDSSPRLHSQGSKGPVKRDSAPGLQSLPDEQRGRRAVEHYLWPELFKFFLKRRPSFLSNWLAQSRPSRVERANPTRSPSLPTAARNCSPRRSTTVGAVPGVTTRVTSRRTSFFARRDLRIVADRDLESPAMSFAIYPSAAW